MAKQRLDLVLVQRGLAPTRTAAQAMIMAGEVKSQTTVLAKPGQLVEKDVEIIITERARYVSRAGEKLASVAPKFEINFRDKVVLDVGSSTGGFTDYALQNGAKQVYAVDIGTGQLAYKLRQDSRVIVMEQTDIRNVKPDQLSPKPDIVVADVSFISLTKILPHVASLVTSNADIIAMAKPQFEADKPTADKYRGVIKDESARQKILTQFEAAIKPDFIIKHAIDSAVAGAKGNLERFYLLRATH